MKLNKQLIEKLANGEIAVDNSNSNLELLRAVLKEAFPKDHSIPEGLRRYYRKHGIDSWTVHDSTILPTIPLSDFLEEEFVLPEKWCVRQNKQEINDWINNNKQTDSYYSDLSGVHLFHFPKISDIHLYVNVQLDYKEITFEQFKKYVLKQETMEKEIIGYKLIKEYPNSKSLQTVYVPTRVEDEILLPEIAYGFITEDNNIFQDKFNEEQILEQYPQKLGFKLLKLKEGIFFTQEEYNKHIKEIIENTLKNGAKSVEIHFDNSQNLSRDFEYAIESKRIWVPKNSILNTFEETYLKYKI